MSDDFEVGDHVRVLRFGNTDSSLTGREGRVVNFYRGYVVVVMDDDEENAEVYFLTSEIEKVEPVLDTDPIDVTPDGYDPDKYAVRINDDAYATCFEFYEKDSGKVLLTTQFVSLSTLLFIAGDHAEGNR